MLETYKIILAVQMILKKLKTFELILKEDYEKMLMKVSEHIKLCTNAVRKKEMRATPML